MTKDREPAVRAVQRNRVREHLAHLDYLRSLRQIQGGGVPQRELAVVLGMSQVAVSKAMRKAQAIPVAPVGFSGASPYEIVQRYAAGELTRDQLVDELTRWEYVPMPSTDGWDDLLIIPAGTFDEVRRGLSEGLLEGEAYDAILDAREARLTGA